MRIILRFLLFILSFSALSATPAATILNLNTDGSIVIVLGSSEAKQDGAVLAEKLSKRPGVLAAKWDEPTGRLLIQHDPASIKQQQVFSLTKSLQGARTGKNTGVAYKYKMHPDAHELSCGTHGYALYSKVKKTPGVLSIPHFLGDTEGTIEIVADPEQINSDELGALLNHSSDAQTLIEQP